MERIKTLFSGPGTSSFTLSLLASVLLHALVIFALVTTCEKRPGSYGQVPGSIINLTVGTGVQQPAALTGQSHKDKNRDKTGPDTHKTAAKHTGGGPESTAPLVHKAYLKQIITKIYNTKFYPRDAQKKNIEGIVTLRFTVLKNGLLKGPVTVLHPSPHPELNNAGKKTVAFAAPFPPFPDSIDRSEITCTVDIDFSLN